MWTATLSSLLLTSISFPTLQVKVNSENCWGQLGYTTIRLCLPKSTFLWLFSGNLWSLFFTGAWGRAVGGRLLRTFFIWQICAASSGFTAEHSQGTSSAIQALAVLRSAWWIALQWRHYEKYQLSRYMLWISLAEQYLLYLCRGFSLSLSPRAYCRVDLQALLYARKLSM